MSVSRWEDLTSRTRSLKLPQDAADFKVAFCLLLSGILKGDKSQTKKPTTINNQPPSQTQANKKTQPPTNKKKPTQNNFKTKFRYCLPPSNCCIACCLSRRKKPKHNLSTFVDYKRLTFLKTEYGVEV